MKVTRQYLGKLAEVVWRDPNTVQRKLQDALKGRAALATWTERGVIDDITDGVVRIVHSAGMDPGNTEIDEITYTVVDEALIERIVVYTPEVTNATP